jgi:DNA-binding response OmpR family regulator
MKRILIIEDDENAALSLMIRLKAHGYAAWVAGDAIKGLSTAIRNTPDLILLDIAIPGGDGFTLAEKLRNVPQTKNVPVIFLTASDDPELRQKVMNLGAAGLLEKPFCAEELLLMIKYAFERPGRARSEVAPAGLATRASERPSRILLVEDDLKIAMGLGIRLKAAGYEPTLAHDGLAGVNAAVKTKPDLLLLDISIPAGNGFTVAERIQTVIPTPIPMIFLTASKRPEFLERAKELGAVGFFEKPFQADALLATMKLALDRARNAVAGP